MPRATQAYLQYVEETERAQRGKRGQIRRCSRAIVRYPGWAGVLLSRSERFGPFSGR